MEWAQAASPAVGLRERPASPAVALAEATAVVGGGEGQTAGERRAGRV